MLLSILLTIFNYVICFQNNKIRLKEPHRFGKKQIIDLFHLFHQ